MSHVIIGHVSDLHVSLGRTGFGGIDALEPAGSAISYFEALVNPPDLVVLTGDLPITRSDGPAEEVRRTRRTARWKRSRAD